MLPYVLVRKDLPRSHAFDTLRAQRRGTRVISSMVFLLASIDMMLLKSREALQEWW